MKKTRFHIYNILEGVENFLGSIYCEKNDSQLQQLASFGFNLVPADEDAEIINRDRVNMIYEFTIPGKYGFLSNFYIDEKGFFYKGIHYHSAEIAFQAQKTLNPIEQKAIQQATTPGVAKKLGRHCTLRKDWERIKIATMEDIIREKFSQSPELKQKLLDTQDMVLIEGNWWHDNFWGVCYKDCIKNVPGVKHNVLGVILQNIRDDFKNEEKENA